jgi:hypothetical protein
LIEHIIGGIETDVNMRGADIGVDIAQMYPIGRKCPEEKGRIGLNCLRETKEVIEL